MKNVLVLGATGRTGRLVVQQLAQVADVNQTVYVRDPNKLSCGGIADLTVVKGDATDVRKLADAMMGQDIVISCLNGDVLSQAKSIVEALKDTEVSRIIWITGMGIHREVPGIVGFLLNFLVRKYPEYVMAADAIADSGVAYTLVRAAHLLDGETTSYHLTNEGEKIRKNSVTRSAVAKAIVDMVSSEFEGNYSLGITNY
ncbi:MAG: SDR family oxidoreductase [Tolumonas sp.]|nr:SDR family oxidoreductase [Tolumonas sp.]